MSTIFFVASVTYLETCLSYKYSLLLGLGKDLRSACGVGMGDLQASQQPRSHGDDGGVDDPTVVPHVAHTESEVFRRNHTVATTRDSRSVMRSGLNGVGRVVCTAGGSSGRHSRLSKRVLGCDSCSVDNLPALTEQTFGISGRSLYETWRILPTGRCGIG